MFFKSNWNIVGKDVKNAIHHFFLNKKLYPAINFTLVALVPRSPGANSMKEMRPISCCSAKYKIISKILTSRLSSVIS